MDFSVNFVQSALSEFQRYKTLGDKTFAQLDENDLHWKLNKSDNSIALIVKHMAGNMLSRWTNFLTEDGEKPWRNRENEFVNAPTTKNEIIDLWQKGWLCLFDALESIDENNFNTLIKIRDEEHTIVEAVSRQLTHYANHVGQIVLMGKMIKGDTWVSLSIAKGGSGSFNAEKFGK